MKLHLTTIATPLDDMLLVTDESAHIHAFEFADHRARLHRLLRARYDTYELIDAPPSPTHVTAIDRYFAGDLHALDSLVTDTAGSDLERRVWVALLEIPPGRTKTYGELARALGFTDPRAAIDIGAAVGANPVEVIVPCHRVIGSNGELKGYAGGPHRKRWLLEHEGALAPVNDLFAAR
ncbi:methylated-DNA--[protein]-cysteine S-methyltransferase [Paraburkholderia flava]|uniref:methylated-DNA--[protein]-cysteine S-methyltransferase n=1 Tax=Paraburkholderia flava TaxID=2547393 RepID=UPI00105C6012|nr:methylated-DNA--[protein]-cysteine S-methyltransferase [Paraburkholderia flava]